MLGAALEIVEAASGRGIPLRLVGGLAVQALCPQFPARTRDGQDLDLATTSKARKALTEHLETQGFAPDRHFNALYGHKQLFFRSEDRGLTLDVLVDRLEMCHTLEFADRLDRLPTTLDVTDLLLSKLQIVELNEKDLHDVVHLLAGFPIDDGDVPGTIALERWNAVLGDDWGWWRTVTGNLERLEHHAELVARHTPPAAPQDPAAQAEALHQAANDAPKSLRWRMRAKVGERKRRYELPEETPHPD
jgi:hypothetical protein